MRCHPLAAVLGLTLTYSPWLAAADTGQPPGVQTPDAFEQTLLEMESTIAELRATSDPVERQRLLREQARSLHHAMRLTDPRGARMAPPPRQSGLGGPPRNLWGPGSRPWGPGERPRARHGGIKAPPAQTGHQRRQQAPYADLEQRLTHMQQRLDEQQLVLDEILKYREPFERLLEQQGMKP